MTPASEQTAPRPLGLVIFMATVVMLFTAFTASYIIRKTAADWRPISLPSLAIVNTLILALSSLSMERARRMSVEKRRPWIGATLVLGLLFLCGQMVVWDQLADAGVFIRTRPHAAFIYLFTSVHGLHLTGGLVALAAALRRPHRIGSYAAYWHFMGMMWLYLLMVLTLV